MLRQPDLLEAGLGFAVGDVSNTLKKGRYSARLAGDPADLHAAQALRALCFERDGPADVDPFDGASLHVLIETKGTLVCCFRLMPLHPDALDQSYAAQFYGLARLRHYPGLMMEMGRFCVHPDWRDPDIVRLAWAMITAEVDQRGVQMLFGCSSFAGVDSARYRDAFGLLRARHLAPPQWCPTRKSAEVVCFDTTLSPRPDAKRAAVGMPPLLRTYLLMGGWVSDHAVVDRQMNTLHVFTGLEIGAIPVARKRLLRALL